MVNQPVEESTRISGSVYADSARAWSSGWPRLIGPSRWSLGGHIHRGDEWMRPTTMLRSIAAAHALALGRSELALSAEHTEESIRSALARWQLSLRSDGAPGRAVLRRSPLNALTAWHIVLLLSEHAQFQTPELLADVLGHVRWVAALPPLPPWLEAARIGALAEAAGLVRDSTWLANARSRLPRLLGEQSPEGWFPEPHGPDALRLSLTVDALARACRQHGWAETVEPIQNACQFLCHLHAAHALTAGAIQAGEYGWVSPYGIELMADQLNEAALLAAERRHAARGASRAIPAHWSDDRCALVGVRHALTAAASPRDLLLGLVDPPPARQTVLALSGIVVIRKDDYILTVNAKKGGAFHIYWPARGCAIEDAGVTLASAKMLTTGRYHMASELTLDNGAVVSRGHLQVQRRTPADTSPSSSRLARLHEAVRRAGREALLATRSRSGKRREMGRHGRFERRIEVRDNEVRVYDHVECPHRFVAAVMQTSATALAAPWPDDGVAGAVQPPLFLEGGRLLEHTRIYRDGARV